jgi:hypothetical protein
VQWIAVVELADDIEAKVNMKHSITADEIREAVCLTSDVQQRWHDHPVYGRRLYVRGATYEGRQLLVVLKPAPGGADGVWECQTAIPWTR